MDGQKDGAGEQRTRPRHARARRDDEREVVMGMDAIWSVPRAAVGRHGGTEPSAESREDGRGQGGKEGRRGRKGGGEGK